MVQMPKRSDIVRRAAGMILGFVLGYVCGGVVPTILGLAVGDAVRFASRGMLESSPHADSYAAPALCLAGPVLATVFVRLKAARPVIAAGFGAGALIALVCAAVDLSWGLSGLSVRDEARNTSVRLGLASYAVAFLTTAAIGVHTASVMVQHSCRARTEEEEASSRSMVEDE